MGEDYPSDVSSVRDGEHWCIYSNNVTLKRLLLNTLWLRLNERHWRQSDAIPDGPFKDVYGHKRLLEKVCSQVGFSTLGVG
jgi:hypothetical protein